MARISVGGGVSDARALPDQPGYIAPATPPVEEPEADPATVEPEPVVEAPAEPDQPAPGQAAPATQAATAPAVPTASATTTQKGTGA